MSTSTAIEQVADGVLRIHRAATNCYLLHGDDGLTLVDAGLPRMWPLLVQALRTLGAAPDDLSAVVLTHGHFDHVGLCDRLRARHGVASHIHAADAALARHPYRYAHQAPRWPYPVLYPAAVPILTGMVLAGALRVAGTVAHGDVVPGAALDVPGSPVPVWSPGHTNGHCGFHLPGPGILFTGDALVTRDPYTGLSGPRLVAKAATADIEANIVSLGNLRETGADLVLPGHGPAFRGGIRRAVDEAIRNRAR